MLPYTKSKILQLAQRSHHFKTDLCKRFKKKALDQYRGQIACPSCQLDHCCHLMAFGTMFEGVILAHELDRMGADRVIAELAQVGLMQSKLLASANWDPLSGAPPDGATARWLRLRIRCPLLVQLGEGKRSRCLHYKLRPSSCATHWVLKGSDCGEEVGAQIGHICSTQALAYILIEDSKFMGAVMGERDGDGILVTPQPLGIAVALGLKLLRGEVEEVVATLRDGVVKL